MIESGNDLQHLVYAQRIHLTAISQAIDIIDFGTGISDSLVTSRCENRRFHDYRKVYESAKSLYDKLDGSLHKLNKIAPSTIEEVSKTLRNHNAINQTAEWGGEVRSHHFELCHFAAGGILDSVRLVAEWYEGDGWESIDQAYSWTDEMDHSSKEDDLHAFQADCSNVNFERLNALYIIVENEWEFAIDRFIETHPPGEQVDQGIPGDSDYSEYKSPKKWRNLFSKSNIEISERNWTNFKKNITSQDHPTSKAKQVRFLLSELESSGLIMSLLEAS